jgi:ribosomal protein S18 acetylase RimI-like enzyme
VVHPEYEQSEVPQELLGRCETYLRKRGAEVVWAGARWPKTPFYCGLYGGVEVPGVLEADPLHGLCPASGYEAVDRTLIFRLNVAAFRPRIDRQQMQFRRRLLVQVLVDPPLRNWWQACILGDFDLTRFEILPRDSREPMAEALVRAVQGSGNFATGPAAGLLFVRVEDSQRRQGMATFVLGEVFRTLASQGVQEVEAQSLASNEPLLGLLAKLGFEQVAQATVYRKVLAQDGVK